MESAPHEENLHHSQQQQQQQQQQPPQHPPISRDVVSLPPYLIPPAQLQQQQQQDQQQQPPLWGQYMISPSNQVVLVATVYGACEEIWRCQSLEKALSWLQFLREAISRDRLDAYDPSEAFLCLQGAAYRFHAQAIEGPKPTAENENKSTTKPEQDESENKNSDKGMTLSSTDSCSDIQREEAVWSVWEDSMWAAAALARICVGPSWRHQINVRRFLLKRGSNEFVVDHANETREGVHEGETAVTGTDISSKPDVVVMPLNGELSRSHSPMTQSSFGNASRHDSYPSIPEVLPASMLRFGASATEITATPRPLERFDEMAVLPNEEIRNEVDKEQEWLAKRVRLVEAQRELVLSILCDTDDNAEPDANAVPKRSEWTIPGIHEPVASMLLFWLETSLIQYPSLQEDDSLQDDNARPSEKNLTLQETLVGTKAPGYNDGLTTLTKDIEPKTENQDKSAPGVADCLEELSSNPQEDGGFLIKDIVNSGTVDWWQVLQVTRSVTDIVTAGWRPPPRTDTGAEIVLCLLKIAEQGIMLRKSDMKFSQNNTRQEAREERLAAASSAAEAVSSLASLGSRGLIPSSTLSHTVTVLCRLQVISAAPSANMSELYPVAEAPSAAGEKEEWELEKETFITQRESCFADTASLLWVLLSHQSSAITTVTTLMRLIDIDINTASTELTKNMEDLCDLPYSGEGIQDANLSMNAAAAMRALGTGLWGSKESRGISSLRIFWLPVLDLVCKVAPNPPLSENNNMSKSFDSSSVGSDGKFAPAAKFCPMAECSLESLAVVFEIIVAIRRLLEMEVISGESFLAPNEWDAFVLLLDQCIIPWLAYDGEEKNPENGEDSKKNSLVYNNLRLELNGLIDQLTGLFEDCARFRSGPFHLTMNASCRRQLHLLLMRKACPYLSEQSTPLALSVIRSWSAWGFLPDASLEWCQTASDILANAFAVYDDRKVGAYDGFVHAPIVRLEALMAVTHESEDPEEVASTSSKSEDAIDENFQIQWSSPLSLTRNAHERHTELIFDTIVPHLVKILGVHLVEPPITDVQHTTIQIPESHDAVCNHDWPSTVNPKESIDNEETELPLKLFAVKILGRLFRNETGEKAHRPLFVKMLQSVVVPKKKPTKDKEKRCVSCDDEKMHSDIRLDEKFYLSLEAIRQVELCLCTPFGTLTDAHESLPSLIELLCSTLTSCGSENSDNASEVMSSRILSLAALLPICRLNISHDQHLVMLEKMDVAAHVPEALMRLLQVQQEHKDEFEQHNEINDAVAPFAVVETGNNIGNSPSFAQNDNHQRKVIEPTIISFKPIVSAILSALNSSKDWVDEAPDESQDNSTVLNPNELVACFRSTCFDALRSLILSGITIDEFEDEISAALSLPVVVKEMKVSRCRAIAAFAEYISARMNHTQVESGCAPAKNHTDIHTLLEPLLQLCVSGDTYEIDVGSKALGVVLPFLTSGAKDWVDNFVSSVSSRLRRHISDYSTRQDISSDDDPVHNELSAVLSALLSILVDILSDKNNVSEILDSEQKVEIMCLLYEVCSCSAQTLNWCARLAALSGAAELVGKIDMNELEKVREKLRSVSSDFYWQETMSKKVPLEQTKPENRLLPAFDDLLRQRYHQELEGSNLNEIPCASRQFYSKETAYIERFVVEARENCSVSPTAAWLFGDNVLTLRLGASSSRYSSWLEIIVRSPTNRKRSTVRLPKNPAVLRPEFPSFIADGDNTQSPKGSPKQQLTASPSVLKKFSVSDESSRAISRAQQLMQRFDRISAVSSIEGKPPSADRDSLSVDAIQTRADHSLSSYKPVPNTPVTKPSSVRMWLEKVLGDRDNIKAVEESLCLLGFSDKVLKTNEDTSSHHFSVMFQDHLPKMERLQTGPKFDRALAILDRTTILQTHKVGLLFAGPASVKDFDIEKESDASFEEIILKATQGSKHFLEFTSGLSDTVLTRHLNFFSGGLDTSEYASDGVYAAAWVGEENMPMSPCKTMILFHLVTLMPEGLNNRKRHVGNDNVQIVYVEQGYAFQPEIDRWGHVGDLQSAVVSGQFGFVTIFVMLLAQVDLVRITVRIRAGLPEDAKAVLRNLTGSCVVAKDSAPDHVRRVAIRADLACRAAMEDRLGLASNWEDRRQQISELRRYLEDV